MHSSFTRIGRTAVSASRGAGLGLAIFGTAVVVAACSGSGGSARAIPRTATTAVPTATPAPTATPTPTASPTVAPAGAVGVLILSVPCDALSTSAVRSGVTAQSARTAGRPRTVSGGRPSASSSYSPASFSLSQQGGGTVVGTIGAPASPCTASSSVPAYSVSLATTPGTHVFTISTYASGNGSGTPLSSVAVVGTIPPNTTVTLHATLATPVASINVTVVPAALELGSTASVAVIVNAVDTAGETIVGPGPYRNAAGGNVTIALSDSDTSGNTKLSTTSVTHPGTTVNLSYNGSYAATSAKVTAAASGFAPSSATVQFACAGAPSTSDLFVLNEAEVVRYATTASGDEPAPAGTLTIPLSNAVGPNVGLGFAVDPNGLTYIVGTYLTTGQNWVATYCPGADGSLPAYRVFTPETLIPKFVPSGFALDASRNVYAVSVPAGGFQGGPTPGPSSLLEYPAGAGAPGTPGSPAPAVAPSRAVSGAGTQMFMPGGLAIDSAGAAYVGDQAQINVFGPTQSGNTAPERTLANTAGGLLEALDVALDAAGNVYVLYDADNQTALGRTKPYGDPAVAEYAPGAATPSRVISGPATTLGTYFGQSQPAQFMFQNELMALAVAPDGTIFVASLGTGKSPTTGATSGTEIAVFGATANGNVAPDRTIDVTALAKPNAAGVYPGQLAADANDTVYIGDDGGNFTSSANGVYAFGAAGTLTAHIAPSQNGIGKVRGLAIDAGGDLVVQSYGFTSATNQQVGQTALFVYSTAGGLSGPTKTIPNGAVLASGNGEGRIAVDVAGDVYELCYYGEVLKFSLTGTSAAAIGSFTDNQASFDTQTGIAVDAAGRLYISEIGGNLVDVYAAGTNGSNVSPIASYWDYAGSTLDVYGETFGTNGTLYATSCDTNSVSIYANGASSASRSIVGPNTKLLCPLAVAVDASGAIYVGDSSGVSTFAAAASGNVPPIRRLTTDTNVLDPSFNFVDGVAVGPGPYAAQSTSNVRGGASAVRMRSSGGRRSARAAAPARVPKPLCVLEENARRAMLARLLPPGSPIPPARYTSPLCRRR